MFRLAHISDIHLGLMPSVKPAQLISKRITGFLNWKLNRKGSLTHGYLEALINDLHARTPDHIAVTGDLVNLSLADEYKTSATFLNNLGTPENITVNCGNHDAYVPGALANSIKAWQPYMSGDDKPLINENQYPVLRKRDDIAIIACNSAQATLPFFATGYFKNPQAERLANILEETRGMYRVIMIHHPPFKNATHWHKRLIGEELFRDVIKNHGAELVLHGHTHLATRNLIDGPHGDVPVICVPAAGNAPGNHRPAGRYNLFSIEKTKSTWSTKMEEYGREQEDVSISLLATHQF